MSLGRARSSSDAAPQGSSTGSLGSRIARFAHPDNPARNAKAAATDVAATPAAPLAAAPEPAAPEVAGRAAAPETPVTAEISENAIWSPPSWDEIVREHSARVYRLAYRLTGNQHDAEDLTQEVFVRVFRSLSSYTPGTFEGWLHRITTNLFLDQARRKQRIRFDGLPDDVGDRWAGPGDGPERAWEHNNLDYDVQYALDQLPPDFRAAVVLCDIEGLSYEEIAATLDVKLGTVRSRIHRGRALLREALAHRRPTLDGGRAQAGSPDSSDTGPLPAGEGTR
jgi:RNA polymerase sigma-70 factor (ECF subfamily)